MRENPREIKLANLDWRFISRSAFSSCSSRAAPPIDGLLFLQRRAGDRQLKHRGVLVSSQGGRLSFWSVSGQARLYGQFYAPEQPGQRVLSLGSDQTGNTVLVCGHSSGWLQVWDICHFAAGDQHQPDERPPLLRSWKAHNAALLSVDVAQVADRSFVLAASADGSTSLWTSDGDGVGQFGQAAAWSLTEAATYQRRALGETTADEKASAGDSAMVGGVKGHVPVPANSGQNGKAPSGALASKQAEDNPEQPQQPLYVCEDSDQREASCQETGHLFGHIRHSGRS